MPNQKISQDPSATPLVGTELIPVVQGGVNKSSTPEQVSDYVEGQLAASIAAKADVAYVDSENATQDAVIANKADTTYVDAQVATKIGNVSEDTTPTLGGDLDSDGNSILNLGAPVSPNDAATKGYVDSENATQDAAIANKADTTYVDAGLAGKANTIHTHVAADITNFTAAAKAATVADAINDGTTDVAPSQNAVFDALATKQPLDAQLTSLAALSYAGNALKVVQVNAAENSFELATTSGGGGLASLEDDPAPTLGANMNANNFDISQVNNLQSNFIYMPNNGVIYVKDFAGSGDLDALGSNAADQLVLGNGTSGILFGTQTDFNGYEATNLADPVNPQDAATKAYVDANAGGGTPVFTLLFDETITFGQNLDEYAIGSGQITDTYDDYFLLITGYNQSGGSGTHGLYVKRDADSAFDVGTVYDNQVVYVGNPNSIQIDYLDHSTTPQSVTLDPTVVQEAYEDETEGRLSFFATGPDSTMKIWIHHARDASNFTVITMDGTAKGPYNLNGRASSTIVHKVNTKIKELLFKHNNPSAALKGHFTLYGVSRS